MNPVNKTKVLLIEPDRDEAALFGAILSEENSQAELRPTGSLASALDRLSVESFDIVFTDLNLPDSNGIGTFNSIHSKFPHIPVVIVSGVDDQVVALDAVRNGAQDYLIKGRAKSASLVRLIRYAIERQRLIAECEKNLREIKTLKGLIPMCAWCRKIYDHDGYWKKVEKYIEEHTDASFSHGICPECLEKTEPQIFNFIKSQSPDLLKEVLETQAEGLMHEINVLLIEDEPPDAEIVHYLAADARDINLKITDARSLSSALDLLRAENFDLILSDLGLPDSRGIETFIKINTASPDVPVVLLTGLSDRELAATVVRSGAQDYLVKGEIDSSLLSKAVRYALERHRMLTELRTNLRAVKMLETEREIILSMFAHDIKNAIMPTSWILSKMISGKDVAREDLVPIKESIISAENMLADFIAFSRLATKEYKPVREAFDIKAAIRKQVEIFRPQAEEKGLKISCSFSEEPFPAINADGPMVERVISNLIENAVKYTPGSGKVDITVRRMGSGILVKVQDTGIGIPEEHIPYIFNAFYRAPGTEKGSGLGLAIARMIVKGHGGKIWVESSAGKGSTFSFTLAQL